MTKPGIREIGCISELRVFSCNYTCHGQDGYTLIKEVDALIVAEDFDDAVKAIRSYSERDYTPSGELSDKDKKQSWVVDEVVIDKVELLGGVDTLSPTLCARIGVTDWTESVEAKREELE